MANALSPSAYAAPMNAFFDGQAAATQQQNALLGQKKAKDEEAMRSIELVGSMALGAKGGKLDGAVDPAKYEQGLDFLASRGLDVSKFRGRPETADMAAHAAVGALNQIKLGQSAVQAAMQMQLQFMQLQQGAQTMQMQRAQFDRQNKNDQFNQGIQTRQLNLAEQAATRKETPSGFRVAANGGLEPIPGGPNDPAYITKTNEAKAKERNMSAGDITKLSEEGGKFANVAGFGKTFDDNFAGYGSQMVGNAAMTAGRYLPKAIAGENSERAASWWQGYDRYKNVVRNDQFGSALTATEKAAFEQADINPGMKPEMIRKNLAEQERIVKASMSRKAQALAEAGYSPEQISAAYGVPAADLGVKPKQKASATPAPSAPAASQPKDAKARITELRSEGLTNEQIKTRLREEGYF